MIHINVISSSKTFEKQLTSKLLPLGYKVSQFDANKTEDGSNNFFIIDLDSADMNYGELAFFVQEYPHSTFMGMSALPRFNQGVQVLKSGMKGYLNSFTNQLNLEHAIKTVLGGGVWIDPGVVQEIIANISLKKTAQNSLDEEDPLSAREMQVAHYVSCGLSNLEIAKQLEITERTVKAHILACYQKLGVHDRVGLVLWVKGRENA
ncbi:MAG: response regulator transcription factor [Sulfurimonas sp.]|uniref:helix-turn-helix domain-containing protein n=1 Tax=Sulfurimonas sp. TaxID=2022749 RepID=UPI00261AB4BB|nr:response regulator transcription factor [Sulfurimonas sp.]MDD2651505.1 response regulator transcription factor [Sulfurimonas sp.]MDD3451046.1 response regulator transcription factor [Sulfurimonas sp.]